MAELERRLETLAKTDEAVGLKATVDLVTREGRIDLQLAELDQFCSQEETRIEEMQARLNPACPLQARSDQHDGVPAARGDRVASA